MVMNTKKPVDGLGVLLVDCIHEKKMMIFEV